VVEGERDRQGLAYGWLALVCHHPRADAPGADDRHLRRHHDEAGEAASDHAEVGERDGGASKLLRRDRARLGIRPHAIEARAQVGRVALADIAQDGNDETSLGIDCDADVDALNEPALAGA